MCFKKRKIEKSVRREVEKYLDSVNEMIFLCEHKKDFIRNSPKEVHSILYRRTDSSKEVTKKFVYGNYGKLMTEYWIKQSDSLMKSGNILWLSKNEITNLETISVSKMCEYLTEEEGNDEDLFALLNEIKRAVKMLYKKDLPQYKIIQPPVEKEMITDDQDSNPEINDDNRNNFLAFKNNASEYLCLNIKRECKAGGDHYEIARFWVQKYLQFDKHGLITLKALAKNGAFFEYAPFAISLSIIPISVFAATKPDTLSVSKQIGWIVIEGIAALVIVSVVIFLIFFLHPYEKERRFILEICEEIEKQTK